MNLQNGKLNLAICISGGGTTMKEVLVATGDGRLKRVNPALIISSDRNAGGLIKALDFGVPTKDVIVVEKRNFKSQHDFGTAILNQLERKNIDLIAMCGWLPLMPINVIEGYEGFIFNQHPGPLDNPGRLGFGGKGMFGKAVHHAVVKFSHHVDRMFSTCATVHRTTERFDEGSIIGMEPVNILPDDIAETLAARVLPKEHALVIQTIYNFSETGKVCEHHRLEPLIHEDEESILAIAEADAIAKYPNG